jgi:hypothetical protein
MSNPLGSTVLKTAKSPHLGFVGSTPTASAPKTYRSRHFLSIPAFRSFRAMLAFPLSRLLILTSTRLLRQMHNRAVDFGCGRLWKSAGLKSDAAGSIAGHPSVAVLYNQLGVVGVIKMAIDPIAVTAIATSVYGAATFLLWWENRQDRQQRDRQFCLEADNRKLTELRSAFYDAWGYWQGHLHRSGDSRVDALQAGTVFEAFIRLECQLRLNGFTNQAHNLGSIIRTNIHGVEGPLAEAGVALGLLPSEYRQVTAVGFAR